MKNEEMFREIMQKGTLEMPFSDIEDEIMYQIRQKERQTNIAKNLRFSWLFLLAGTVFGIVIAAMLPSVKTSVLGISPQNMTILFQVIFAMTILLQLDSLISFMRRHKITFSQLKQHAGFNRGEQGGS